MADEEQIEILTILQAPVNSTGFSYGAQSFVPDANGLIQVPAALVPLAFSHGFTQAPLAATPLVPPVAAAPAVVDDEGDIDVDATESLPADGSAEVDFAPDPSSSSSLNVSVTQ